MLKADRARQKLDEMGDAEGAMREGEAKKLDMQKINPGSDLAMYLSKKGVVIDRVEVPVEFSPGKEIMHQTSGAPRFISHCTYEGRSCIFKYETESQGRPSNRFKIDMRLARLGISPQIFFPNAEDIDSNKYDYAIYEKVRVLNDSIIRDMSGAKTLQRLKDMIIILTEFEDDEFSGLYWADNKIQNMGINERNELVILDGVEWGFALPRQRAEPMAETIYTSRFSGIISKAGGGRKLKRKRKKKKSLRRRRKSKSKKSSTLRRKSKKNASKKRTRRRRRR